MRPHGASLRAMLVHQGAKPGSLAFKPWEMPDPAALDAEYFDDDPKRFVQMRPVLRHEQVPGRSFGPADRIIATTAPSELPLRAFVRMKPGYRDNTPRNVRIAIRQVMKFDPIAGLVFHFAMDGVDPAATFALIEQEAELKSGAGRP